MTKRNAANEHVKRAYLQRLKEVEGRDEASIDAVAKAIDRFEEHSKHRDFKKFHVEQVCAFKRQIATTKNVRTGQPLSASTIHSTLAALKAFFFWLAQQRGYRSRIKFADTEYFNAPDNLSRVATARRYKACPTLKQIRAIVSFKLKHIDIESELIEQDAREVRTKRAKTFTTWFFPVGEDIRNIFVEWVAFLREQKSFGPEDPLFPKSKVALGDNLEFRAVGLDRAHWANANSVRTIFREASERAGLPYFNPHSFRNTLVQVAYERKLDAERFKAWSQNLGHENCLTTFSSYGEIPPARQAEIIRGLASPDPAPDAALSPNLLRKIADQMEGRGAGA